MRIQFVCAGNICRSVIAARLLRARGPGDVEVASSGLIADPDDAIPNPMTVRAAATLGIDVSDHRARRFDPDGVRADDLVLVMERGQQAEVRSRASVGPDRVLLLGSFAAELGDEIADPGGHPVTHYDACAEHIRAAVDGLVAWLRTAAK